MPRPVIKTVEVPCPPETAFRLFVRDIGQWWPLHTHSISALQRATAAGVAFEPEGPGGQLVETDPTGKRHLWGTVEAYKPGHRLSFTWHVGRKPSAATFVTLTFAASAEGTTVTLTHEGWEALAPDANIERDGYDHGWVPVLQAGFAAHCAQVAAAACTS